MAGIVEAHVEDFLRELYPKEKGLLRRLRYICEEEGLPILERESARVLHLLVSLQNPRRILELGTCLGYSAALMAEASRCEELITIEHWPSRAIRARAYLKALPQIQVLEGDAHSQLKSLAPGFDLIFIDAAKAQYLHYWEESKRLLAPGGMIIFDDVLYQGMLTNRKLYKRRKITIVKRLKKLLVTILNDDTWKSCLLPIGDGMLVVKENDEPY